MQPRLLILTTLLTLHLHAQTPPPATYLLGPGDQLTIFVANSPATPMARKLLILGSPTGSKMTKTAMSSYAELTAKNSATSTVNTAAADRARAFSELGSRARHIVNQLNIYQKLKRSKSTSAS